MDMFLSFMKELENKEIEEQKIKQLQLQKNSRKTRDNFRVCPDGNLSLLSSYILGIVGRKTSKWRDYERYHMAKFEATCIE